MDYKEKYERALERAREQYNKRTPLYDIESIFPELKENENNDERIRKDLTEFIKSASGGFLNSTIPCKTFGEWLEWLEKQGKQSAEPKWYHHKVDLSDCSEEYRKAYYDGWNNCNMQHSQREAESNNEDERMRKEIIDFLRLPHPQFVGKRNHEKWIDWLEKQGKEEYALKPFRDKDVHKFMQYIEKQAKTYEFNLPNRGYDIYAFAKDILTWLEKQGEQKPMDKVEPKFKLRDWIVDYVGNYWRVVKVRPNYYELDGDDGVKTRPTRKYVDEKYHLWTIDDAKKGDMLVVDGVWIVEFDKKMSDGCPWKDTSILTSFEYDMDDDTCTPGSHIFYGEIWPASKEDIDLFEKKRNEYLASNSHNESNLKVGDRVVINCREEFATTYNGKEGTIINIFDVEKNHWGNIVVVLDNGMRNTFYASELIKK